MGSLADNGRLMRDDGMDMNEVTSKRDLNNSNNHEGSCSSSVSTPEPDGEAVAQDSAQRQKRKGGRKPIYATSEERKQRNRQAQAAFRERRTEYIKQLESNIKANEDSLQTLQQSHRNAADECLMLRYKNSLLERILLEKGIDVQAELQLKNGSPSLPPAKPATQVNNSSPLSRPPMNQQSERPAGVAPKLDAIRGPQVHGYNMNSPQLQPTPASHISSPSAAKSPGYPLQGGVISPATTDGPHTHQQQNHNLGPYQRPQMAPQASNLPRGPNVVTPSSTNDMVEPNVPPGSGASGSPLTQARASAGYYLPPFPKHYDQLDQEYDAQTEIVDNHETDGPSEANTYAEYNSSQSPAQGAQENHHSSLHVQSVEGGGTNNLLESFDPMLDSDPFGLTASMHFPTPFSYNQNHPRS